MTSVRATWCCLCVFVFIGPDVNYICGSMTSAAENLENVNRAWTTRERNVRTVEIIWNERRTVVKGALSSSQEREPGRVVPAEDVTYDVDRVILRLGPDGRIYRETKVDDLESSSLSNGSRSILKSAFNGQLAKDYTQYLHPSGVIFGARYPDWRVLPLRPVALIFRPLSKLGSGIDLASARLVTENVEIDDVNCIVIAGSEGRAVTWKMYLDPVRDYVPIRYEEFVERSLSCVIDIHFQGKQSTVYVPSGWSASLVNPDGTLIRSYVANVQHVDINEVLDDSKFEITYPVGTWVEDNSSNKQWIVREDDIRPITAAELNRNVTYDELVSTESGMAGVVGPDATWRQWVWLGILTGVIVCVCGYFFRRHFNRKEGIS